MGVFVGSEMKSGLDEKPRTGAVGHAAARRLGGGTLSKMPRSKTSKKSASSRRSRASNTAGEEVRLEDIRVDAKGIAIAPEILAGLPMEQVLSPKKRAEWVRLRKLGWVTAEN